MSKNAIVIALVVLLVIVGGWYLMRPKPVPAPSPVETTQTPASTESANPSTATQGAITAEKNLVTITNAGFSPKDITIKVGDTVTWVNSDSADHTVNSAPHPSHTTYLPLNLGAIKPGNKASLVFPKAGTYKYHDHLNPSLFGSIIVE